MSIEDYKEGMEQREVVKKYHMRFSEMDLDGSGILERNEAASLGNVSK